MKIIQLTAENVKKLRTVEITPDGNLVQITGRNGSGKSSVLDSIYWALAGTKPIQSQPIRKGEKSARIQLKMGELTVTRKFTEAGSTLVVEAASGARFTSPQRMLDDLLGEIAFDPLEFSRMEAKEQFELIRRLVPIEVDIDALDGLSKRDYDERTDVNRRAKATRAQADAIRVPEGLPAEPVDIAGLLKAMEDAGQQNTMLERRRAGREQAQRDADTAKATAKRDRERAAELRAQAEAMERQAEQQEQHAAGLQKKIDDAEPLPEPIETAALRRDIDMGQLANEGIKARQRKAETEKIAAELEAEAKNLTEAIAAREAEKAKAIAAAPMPIAGLSFGDRAILMNGLPFDQASSAEQLRASVAIAMAMNPKLRVLRIKDGSLLDEDGLKLLAEMATAGDYQIWIERVDSSGKVGIVMDDGMVAPELALDAAE